jgi:hypothetical protein
MIDDVDPAILLASLSAVTLDGLGFSGAVRLEEQDRALGRVLSGAEYAALLPDGVSPEAAVMRFAGGEPLALVRSGSEGGKQKIGRRVDVRQSLEAVGLPASGEASRLEAALGWSPGRIVTFRVAVSALGSARPSEVIETLCGAEVAAASSLCRLGLRAHGGGRPVGVAGAEAVALDAGVDPLDLVALRQMRPPRREAAPAGLATPAAQV